MLCPKCGSEVDVVDEFCWKCGLPIRKTDEDKSCLSNLQMVIVDFSKTSSSDGVAKILNTNTMETSELVINKSDEFSFFNLSTVYPISENKFAVSFVGKKICFYDLDGNQLFDTTNYKLSTYDQDITFKDDKCSFTIKNNGGTLYNITINSKGEVIDSYEVSE